MAAQLFCTLAELKAKFGLLQINQLTAGNSSGNDTVGQAAVDQANAVVEGLIRVRYPNTLVEITINLKNAALHIAHHDLWKDKTNDRVRERYEDSMKYLEGIRDGKNTLGVYNTDTKDEGTVQTTQTDTTKVFTTDSLNAF